MIMKAILILHATLMYFAKSQNLVFNNPIFGRMSADPSILKLGEYYYLTFSESRASELTIYKSQILTNFRNVEKKLAYKVPSGYSNLWSAEMHQVNGELYIYFSMGTGSHWNNQRMYVIKADDPSNPMGGWSDAIRLLDDWDYDAFDGTIMKHNNCLYFVWASRLPTRVTNLFIAPMTSPTWIGNPKQLLREPRERWECQGGCANEGPHFIYNRNVSYMIFSASSTWNPDHCLSYLSIREGADPLIREHWQSWNRPVFGRNDDEDVYTTGSASFTVSPDGTETWMVYHGTVSPVHLSERRTARLEKIEWNEDGNPLFPRPHGYDHAQPVPSGQNSISTCISVKEKGA